MEKFPLLLFFTFHFFCTGGNVSQMSAPETEASHALILDVSHAQTMLTKALGEQKEAEQLLWEGRRLYQQEEASFKHNVNLTDVLQIQLERLREERASLKSNASQLRKKLFHSPCPFFHWMAPMALSVSDTWLVLSRSQLQTLPAWVVLVQRILLLLLEIRIPDPKDVARQQGAL